jgi:hypothetical protein
MENYESGWGLFGVGVTLKIKIYFEKKSDLKVIFKITIVKILEKNSGMTLLQYIPFDTSKFFKKIPSK